MEVRHLHPHIGYEFKRESTNDKGVHIHGFLYFNGHEVKNDIVKAKQICNYWIKEIDIYKI